MMLDFGTPLSFRGSSGTGRAPPPVLHAPQVSAPAVEVESLQAAVRGVLLTGDGHREWHVVGAAVERRGQRHEARYEGGVRTGVRQVHATAAFLRSQRFLLRVSSMRSPRAR